MGYAKTVDAFANFLYFFFDAFASIDRQQWSWETASYKFEISILILHMHMRMRRMHRREREIKHKSTHTYLWDWFFPVHHRCILYSYSSLHFDLSKITDKCAIPQWNEKMNSSSQEQDIRYGTLGTSTQFAIVANIQFGYFGSVFVLPTTYMNISDVYAGTDAQVRNWFYSV